MHLVHFDKYGDSLADCSYVGSVKLNLSDLLPKIIFKLANAIAQAFSFWYNSLLFLGEQ